MFVVHMTSLAIEVAIISVVTAAILALAVRIGGTIDTIGKALMVGGITGALIHLGFEVAGLNSVYCKLKL